MKITITNKKDLAAFIENNGDYNPELTYLYQDQVGDCFALYGCTYATEGFNLVAGGSLIITDKIETTIMENYNETEMPEMINLVTEGTELAGYDVWVGYGDVDGVRVKATYLTSVDSRQVENDDIDWDDALNKIESIDDDDDVVKTLWIK